MRVFSFMTYIPRQILLGK